MTRGFTHGGTNGATHGGTVGNRHGLPPPEAASNLTASPGAEGEIDLTWTAGTDADRYNIYRATSSGATKSDYTLAKTDISSTSYTDTGLLDGEGYFYRVESQNNTGTSNLSNEATAITVLPAPTGLSVSNVATASADLSWTNNHDYGSVTVQYRRSSNSTWQDWASGLSRSTDTESLTGLLHGEEYDTRILAVTEHTTTEDA